MTSFEKLKTKLAELFQLDQADLDFGIYRIMNARRDEIIHFLDQDLLPQVREAFARYKSADKVQVQAELDKVIEGLKAGGVDPEQAPKVKELRAKLATEAVDVTALENEVYDHLYSFFSRYYDEGDFISLRRYKEGVYAIPYEGEEVKLHWANADQYYIKTAENFRDYAFRTPSGHRIHFKIAEADTEKDNIKAANGKDRRFLLHGDKPVAEENGELVIRFEYRPDDEGRRQDAINAETVRHVIEDLNDDRLAVWQHRLSSKWCRADGTETERTILEKRLDDYTKKNTFDYFIHKDLGGFLRRELDFYIKNEVMRLDDIEEESAPRVEQYLSKIKALRRIAHKIIDFLAQIESFQKKLWLKKKFVVETNYCTTLSCVPEELYPEIAANDAQREEWVRFYRIDLIEADLTSPGYSEPLTVEFLKAHPTLVTDTCFFDACFRERLLASPRDLDETIGGLLIHSDNFHGLNLLQRRLSGQVRLFYIDPPYNTGSDEFLYKDSYQHSSWLSMMCDRCGFAIRLLSDNATAAFHINDIEHWRLRGLNEVVLSQDDYITTVTTKCATASSFKTVNLGPTDVTDHVLLYAKCKRAYVPAPQYIARRKVDLTHFSRFVENRQVPPEEWRFVSIKRHVLKELGYDGETTQRAMKLAKEALGKEAEVIVQRKCEEFALSNADRVFDSKLFQKPSPWLREHIERSRSLDRVVELKRDNAASIYLYKGRQVYFLENNFQEVEGNRVLTEAMSNLWSDIDTNNLLYEGDVPFSAGKKPLLLVRRIISMSNNADGEYVLDFFAGSGTLGHAVIQLNELDGGNRKYVLLEMGAHFDTSLLPRLKKAIYSDDWRRGTPGKLRNSPHMFKYIRLESYEDALANIVLRRTTDQQKLLDGVAGFRESYMLRYMLDVESKDSQTLLNIDNFDDPFNYKLLIGTGSAGETKPVNVDLVETFNWLLGLKVRHIDCIQGFRIVAGTSPKGERVLVIWRKIRDLSETDPERIAAAREQANNDLETFFRKQQYNTLDSEYDLIYVNGDNNLMNVPLDPDTEGVEPRYKVRLIEEEFQKLMFDVKDV